MVRDKDNIYAEANDEDTVLVDENSLAIVNDGLVTGKGNKFIQQKADDTDYGFILFLVNGVIQELPIIPNKLLGTDANGNLAWV